jgi:LuxR family transcriptional regulator, maltose regulon positive regulatory protein
MLPATATTLDEDAHSSTCRTEVAEYLTEAVLARQPPDVRRFLLRTCLPSRLTPELCDALTGGDDGARMLGRLDRAGLFLVPIDARPRWFRYHSLFRAFLRGALEHDAEERPAELHRAAAAWFGDHGHFVEAAEHAFRGGDAALAAKLLDDGALASVRRGESVAVLRGVRRLSPETLRAHPRLAVAAAWAHLLRRDAEQARRALSAIDRQRARKGSGSSSLDDELACIDALAALAEDRIGEVATLALAKRSKLSCDGTFEHGVTCNIAALGLAALGRFEDARRLAIDGKASHRRAGSAFGEAFSLAIHGAATFVQGAPREALAIYRRVNEIPRSAEGHAHARAVVATPLADALYELDRLDEAEAALRTAGGLAADFAWVDASGNPHLTRARLRAARGDLGGALRILEDGDFEATMRRFPRMAATLRWEEVRLLTRAGRLVEAEAKARRIEEEGPHEAPDASHYVSEAEARDLTRLRLAIRIGGARASLPVLATEAAQAKQRRRLWRWLKAQTLQAEALDALGERRQALRVLREVLLFGTSRGFVRSFADEGAAIVPLLDELRDARTDGDGDGTELGTADLDRILAAARGIRLESPLVGAAAATTEPLSPRERELLGLVDLGLSNRSIARRLCVSENTVKTHVRHIYGKLHVSSRTAALALARRQGLLA